jgi:arylsulfatase A-like enzyme
MPGDAPVTLQSSGIRLCPEETISMNPVTEPAPPRKPNVVLVFGDQWRASEHGYAGNREVQTPHLDALARESVDCSHCVATMPVCSPWRASLLTGQFPLTHGLFLNDLRLSDRSPKLGQCFADAGYDTAWIGKWHVDGSGRDAPIPPDRRCGFEHWRVLECTHNYLRSAFYADNDTVPRIWPGYDADSQTADAVRWIEGRRNTSKPFLAVLAWGPPHDPYRDCPPDLLAAYDAHPPTPRPNVPDSQRERHRRDGAGYYAHIAALDRCAGRLIQALKNTGEWDNTVFVYTSDHGEMLGSHGLWKKQKPWDESIRVPLLVRAPGVRARQLDAPVETPDLMPTLLGLAGLDVPDSAEGRNLAPVLHGKRPPDRDRAALILCPAPFGEWAAANGGRAYRGVRTRRHTFVRDLQGDWLLYDNHDDPSQMRNRAGDASQRHVRNALDEQLRERLRSTGDDFATPSTLVHRCGYRVDRNGTVDYLDPAQQGQSSKDARV